MTIWWCITHGDTGQEDRCLWRMDDDECRMVRMRLVPVETQPASYDIEIPDFVNRHGTVRSE